MAAARERLGKYVPAAEDAHATVEIVVETGVSTVVRSEE
jgi:hypothetical protein